MIVPVEVAYTLKNQTFAALASWPGEFIIEIGSSDRNTADEEILPRWSTVFLITAEPLFEKVARGLARRKNPDTVKDSSEPLGQHHDRGLILPIAVGPTIAPDGETQTFHVSGNAGCSSLAKVTSRHGRKGFGAWCRSQHLPREVWVVPLKTLISYLPADAIVDFLKIDAQGHDLEVVKSGGKALSERVRYVQMEVISDDCDVLYEDQPKCSEVRQAMLDLGFVALSEVYNGKLECQPIMDRAHYNHYCELDVVFENEWLKNNVPLPVMRDGIMRIIHEHNNMMTNGCSQVYEAFREEPSLPPSMQLIARKRGAYTIDFYDSHTREATNTSFAKSYACPVACFKRNNTMQRKTKLDVCPW